MVCEWPGAGNGERRNLLEGRGSQVMFGKETCGTERGESDRKFNER